MNKSSLFKRAVKLFTFTDIPIRRKLLLFAAGGLCWFLIIALISFGAISYVNFSSKKLTDEIVPQIKTGQKVIIKLRGANVSAHNIVIYDDIDVVSANIRRAKVLLNYVTAILKALLEGGGIRDYSDLTGELIEEFHVASIKGDTVSEKYIKEVLANNQNLREILNELASIKSKFLERGELSQKDESLIMSKLDEYDAVTVKSATVLDKFTSRTSKLQKEYTEKIKTVLYQSTVIVLVIGALAVLLLIVFSSFLKSSITRPIKAITEQIKGLSEGEVDLTKQITISSKDEIGELSTSFNILIHTIHDLNIFKKVIEEDDTVEDVYTRLARVFKENLGLNDLSVYEVSNSKNTMRLIPTQFSDEEICCDREMLLNCELCRAKKTGRIVSSAAYPDICKQFLHADEKYHICIPMIVRGSTGGVVQFLFEKPCADTSYIDKKVLRAQQYIKESLPVIETKRLTRTLKESAMKDQMTGLYNRRFLEEYLDTLIAGVLRKKGSLGLLMCDLDFFKEVNDKYGHDVGDAFLKKTADIIAKNARASDIVVRFGGEEFLVILNDAEEGYALETAERIREKIEETKLKTAAVIVQKTISVGISEFPKDTENFWEAIKYADVALYKAKEAGKNKVLRFTKEMWTEEEY